MKLFSHLLPYLLLVSFSAGPMNGFGLSKLEAVNRTPYDGVAIRLTGQYDTARHSMEDFDGPVKLFRRRSRKQVWPWLFFNRFLGSRAGDKNHSPLSGAPAFRRIKGMDIYNEDGALGDFFERMGMALSIARSLGSPGIVIDPEFYNDYEFEDIRVLAGRIGRPEAEVERGLEAIGARMCDIANQKYPGCTIWFLATGLTRTRRVPTGGRQYMRSFTYIVQGLLERAKSTRSGIILVSGGEITVGYCPQNIQDLREHIRRRQMDYAPLLKAYPNLRLGGTAAPWMSRREKTGWMRLRKCGTSKIAGIEDFEPLVKELMASYRYVWVYSAWAGGYDPFEDVASAFPAGARGRIGN